MWHRNFKLEVEIDKDKGIIVYFKSICTMNYRNMPNTNVIKCYIDNHRLFDFENVIASSKLYNKSQLILWIIINYDKYIFETKMLDDVTLGKTI